MDGWMDGWMDDVRLDGKTYHFKHIVIIPGEMIEMGGINDPERGALIYQRKTQVKKTEGGQKRIKKITEETSWIGKQPSKKKACVYN